MRPLLGGKGANLAEMTRIGLPVPDGFTITTEACVAYLRENGRPAGLDEQVAEHLATLEERSGKRLGDRSDPLLVSVRSGAVISMPGMMDTILNLGMNDGRCSGWPRRAAASGSRTTPTVASSRCSGTWSPASTPTCSRTPARRPVPTGTTGRRPCAWACVTCVSGFATAGRSCSSAIPTAAPSSPTTRSTRLAIARPLGPTVGASLLMMGVTPFAVLSPVISLFSGVPYFNRAAWTSVQPEYNPFK